MDVGVYVRRGRFLRDYRVGADSLARSLGVADVVQHIVERFVLRVRLSASAVLHFQRGLRDLPALVVAAYEVVAGNSHVVEEEDALVVAGKQVHALLRQTLRRERNHEVAEVAMPRRVRVGHEGAEEVVRLFHAADPYLLPVQDEVVAVAHRSALEGGEVGAGVRLGEVLEGDLVGAEQRLEELVLLSVVRPDQQRREDEAVGEARHYARAPELFEDDGLMLAGESAAAVLLRVGRVEPALLGESLVHIAPEVVLVPGQLHAVNGGAHIVRDVGLQPSPDFGSKFFLVFRVRIGEIHPIGLLPTSVSEQNAIIAL